MRKQRSYDRSPTRSAAQRKTTRPTGLNAQTMGNIQLARNAATIRGDRNTSLGGQPLSRQAGSRSTDRSGRKYIPASGAVYGENQ